MTEPLTASLKIAFLVFMVGSLLDMGLRLDPRDAVRASRDVCFVAYSLLWAFVIGPAVTAADAADF